MKLTKTQKGIGIAAVLLVLGYFLFDGYKKRWQLFDLDGNTQWGSLGSLTRHPGKFAIRATDPNHGIQAADTIMVEHSSSRYPSAEYKVLEILTVGAESWIVLDKGANDGADIKGRFKLVKRA